MSLPEQIGQYRLEAHLGSGRYADTYRATNVIRKRTVALKLLHLEAAGDEAKIRRLLASVQQAAELVHPHIAWVWETGEIDGHLFVAERYVNGPSLASLLAEKGALSWDAARLVIQQTAQALDFAHGRGWVHGRISPAQILVSPELGAVLTGFGWPQSTIPDAEAAGGELAAPGAYQDLPSNGRYLAPEVWLGQPARPPADQYALACVWAELLSGQPLFGAATWEETRDLHFAPPPLQRTWPEGTPWPFEAALARALSGEPVDRYPDLAALMAAPDVLAGQGGRSVEDRAGRSAELRARREQEQHTRQQAEEAARLVALAQARQEMEEQIHRERQAPAPVEEIFPPAETSSPPSDMIAARRKTRRSRAIDGQQRKVLWIGLTILLLALAGFWLSGPTGLGGLWAATSTATPPNSATASEVSLPTATPTPSTASSPTTLPSSTPTATHTATAAPTAAPTHTPTITPTNTPVSSPTRTPTRTPTPRDRPDD
jgi:serine/threonine-protein kinase